MYNLLQYNIPLYNGLVIQKLLSEGITLSDAQSKVFEKALAETALIPDVMTRMLTIRRTLVESSLFLTDAQGNITVKGVPEQVILTDWLQIREPETNTDFH